MTDSLSAPPPYASAAKLIREELQLLLPPTRETIDEYAAKNRRAPRAKAATASSSIRMTRRHIWRFRCARSGHTAYLTTAVVGPAQCGKTVVAENELQHAVEKQPGSLLWYMQTDESVEAYVKARINPMVQAHPGMLDRLGDRPEDDAQHFKNFGAMRAEFLSYTHSNLINKNAPLIVADEWDAYDESHGDPKTLLDVRRQYYGRLSHLLAISHPDRATGLDPTKALGQGHYAALRRQHPVCLVLAVSAVRCLVKPGADRAPGDDAGMAKDGTLDEIERGAHLLCPSTAASSAIATVAE
jgi:phage terminase large subunit GpA-like protein